MKQTLIFQGKPKAIQSFKMVKTRGYQPRENIEWKNYIKILAMQQLNKEWQISDGYISINKALFVFSPPSSMKKSEKIAIENGDYVLKNTRPDMSDNLFKGVIDALTGILWTDDARICRYSGNMGKVYGKEPRIEFEFETIDNNIVSKDYFK